MLEVVDKNILDILNHLPISISKENLIFLGYRGSISHNTYVPSTEENGIDDIDLVGVFFGPADFYIGLGNALKSSIEHKVLLNNKYYDCVFYEFRHFMSMLLRGNPNIVPTVWVIPDHIIMMHSGFNEVVENRRHFLGKQSLRDAFIGYARKCKLDMEPSRQAYEGYMGEKRKAIVNKYGYDCYQESSTEFLTNSGWKKFDSVSNKDLLGTVDVISGKFKFQKPISKVDKLHTGKMYIVEPYTQKCVITENHNLLISPAHRHPSNNYSIQYDDSKSDWMLRSMIDIKNSKRSIYHIRRSVVPTNTDYKRISDIYLRLAGLFLTDGTLNFRNKKVECVRLTQTKPDNGFYSEADALINILGGKKYIYPKETMWIIHGDVAQQIYKDFGHSKNKHLPKWAVLLSRRQTSLLWNNLLLGDGTKKVQYNVLYTTNKRLADQIQLVLTISGICCTVDGPYKSSTPYGNTYSYHVVVSNMSKSTQVLYTNRVLKEYEAKDPEKGYPIKEFTTQNERVVCFETPNGTLITRNSGKISIHGNCKNASHAIRLLTMCKEALETGSMNVYRTKDRELLIDIKQGKFKKDEVTLMAKSILKEVDIAYDKYSFLPNFGNLTLANDIVKRILKQHLLK